MADSRASFLWAIKQQESGGDYNVVNSGSGALGAYQVMPDNVASWTQQALGKALTPQQFLSDPSAQDRVAESILGGYYDKYGARGAAAMWYSGQPDPNKTYGSPSVADYVNQVISRMTSAPPADGSTPTQPGSGVTGAGLSDSLAGGLSQGIAVAAKSVLAPTLQWFGWVLITGTGVGLMILGSVLILQQSKPAQELKKGLEKVAAVETGGKAPKKTSAPRTRKPKKKAAPTRVKSTKTEFKTEQQATEPTSFGPPNG